MTNPQIYEERIKSQVTLREVIERHDRVYKPVGRTGTLDERIHRVETLQLLFECNAARVIDADKWEDDPIERARRIWEWWKARVKGVSFFKYWPLALRLVVLVQPSSAFVERVFSEIKLIIEQIGVSSLEETIEARTMVRCNRFK